MKILISADMEGISGITQWDMVTPGHPEYSRGRVLMTGDVNAAIAGAFEAGATKLVVSDGHWDGRNILIEALDARANLMPGTHRLNGTQVRYTAPDVPTTYRW